MYCRGTGKKNAAMGSRLTPFSTFTTAKPATLLGAALYLLLRPFLVGTGAMRVLTSALGFGLTFAAVIIHPGGVDFTQLEPLWLGVALFVALPVVVVALFSALAEYWLRDESWFMKIIPG